MTEIHETYSSYLFPVLAVICCGLLFYFKKKMMVNFPEAQFLDMVTKRRNELDQFLLRKYMVTGGIFAFFCLILIVLNLVSE